MSDQHRLTLSGEQLEVVQKALDGAIAADLLALRDLPVARDVLELVHERLPAAETSHLAGQLAGGLMLREEVLRVLLAAEDGGRLALTLAEVDDRIEGKPAGQSVRVTVEQLAREKLISRGAGEGTARRLQLTGAGRIEARRERPADLSEHAVVDAWQLLDLIYRASHLSRTTRWIKPRFDGDVDEVPVDAIWHVPLVQANAGVSRERFEELLGELRDRDLVGPAGGSYLSITQAGVEEAVERHRASRGMVSGYGGSGWRPMVLGRVSAPRRRPREFMRKPIDALCPVCGQRASWLHSRKSARWEALRETGAAQYTCETCDTQWAVYAEPVDRAGQYDPYADPTVCRVRWAYQAGRLLDAPDAPPDHYGDAR